MPPQKARPEGCRGLGFPLEGSIRVPLKGSIGFRGLGLQRFALQGFRGLGFGGFEFRASGWGVQWVLGFAWLCALRFQDTLTKEYTLKSIGDPCHGIRFNSELSCFALSGWIAGQ